MKLFLLFEALFVFFLVAKKLWSFGKLSPLSKNLLIERWSFNFSIELINRFLIFLLFAFIIFEFSFPSNDKGILFFVFYVAILDFIFYWRHRFYHRWLWGVHKLHHSDPDYDFTLSMRIHPFETLIQVGVFFSTSFALGANEWQIILAAQLFTTQALLSHFENRIPQNKITQILRKIFVFPDDHRHHHGPIDFNTNFGFLFSFWDQWFKTAYRG